MKSIFYVAVLITFFSCKENSTSQKETASGKEATTVGTSPENPPKTPQEVRSADVLRSVDDIKTEYAYITSILKSGRMDSTSFEYDCRSEKSGRVVYFSEKGQLRMIKHTYHEYSHFSATDTYFVKDNALFFAFYKHVAWSFVNQNQTKDDVTEKRLYLIGNKSVKCLQKKYALLSDANATDAPAPDTGANKETDCSSLEPIVAGFELLFDRRNQKENLACLTEKGH